jgi:hypothetical protein
MQIKGATGRLVMPGAASPGVQVTRAEANIPNLARSATVAVSADVRGPLAESLAIVNSSPLAGLMGNALDKATATGNADVRLNLTLPVNTIDRSRVQGSVTLAGNDVQITPDSPVLARARGVVQFSETGFALAGAQARMLGGDVRLEGASRVLPPGAAEPSVVFRAQGTFSAEGLRQARELGFFSRLGQSMQGAAAYSATLAFRRGVPELAINSSLQGLALSLPPPLNKTAETALPLRYDNALLRESHARGRAPAGPDQPGYWPRGLGQLCARSVGRPAACGARGHWRGPGARRIRARAGAGRDGQHQPGHGGYRRLGKGAVWRVGQPAGRGGARAAASAGHTGQRGTGCAHGPEATCPRSWPCARASCWWRAARCTTSWWAARATAWSGAPTWMPTSWAAMWNTASPRVPAPGGFTRAWRG